MIPNIITADDVFAAIAEIDRAGIPAGRAATRYQLVHQGHRYPPKYVISLAAKYATRRELLPEKFSGGKETNSFLQRRGFEIENISTSARTNAANNGPKPTRTRSDNSTANHVEHCQECKAHLLRLLSTLYGQVVVQKRFDKIGTTPQAFNGSEWFQQLTEIFAALQRQRDFADFVKATALPACDYFLPIPGFIVEFDEAQHFTPLRERALSLYPPSLSLGFDRKIWAARCREIHAQDNDPPYRDEQRAWYDTLRDFLPTIFPLRPTVRLYSHEDPKHPWCKLNPSDPEDVERFRQILSDRVQLWTIDVHDAQSPKFGRVVMDGAWSGDLNAARRLLDDVARALRVERRLACLCTCGAFLTFDWPDSMPKQGCLNPTAEQVDALTTAAQTAVSSVLTDDIALRLAESCDYLTLGVDTKKSKVSTTQNSIREPHAELVCVVNLRRRTFHWTGKFYPTNKQERTIVRLPDLKSHFITLDCGPAMILGCHDLTVYNPRAWKTASGWRKQVISEFRALAKASKPIAILHHPHTTVKRKTWKQSWGKLETELPSVKIFLGTGAYSYKDGGWDQRNDLAHILPDTQRGGVLNVVVRLACCSTGAETETLQRTIHTC